MKKRDFVFRTYLIGEREPDFSVAPKERKKGLAQKLKHSKFH